MMHPIIVKTLGALNRDFQSVFFLLETRLDVVSRCKLLSAMFLTQNPDFRFGGGFEFFEKYFVLTFPTFSSSTFCAFLTNARNICCLSKRSLVR